VEKYILHSTSTDKFNQLVDYALEKKIPIGFDSCSAIKSMYAFESKPNYDPPPPPQLPPPPASP